MDRVKAMTLSISCITQFRLFI